MSSAKQLEKALFEELVDLENTAARETFLDLRCRDQPALRVRLERLLALQKPADTFLNLRSEKVRPSAKPESRGAASPETGPHEAETPPAGVAPARIGRYQLRERLGEGGCGVVYLAEQQEPVRREVALKIIRLGMDTETIIARFEMERQALALMDHPNIARVLDAGATETGRPYFVMELVRGIRITDYCDRHRLGTGERLDLFVQVCHAIQHAHQKGIIHRDIKPSNILVALQDGMPVPKVIDFGIAKAVEGRLTDNTVFTANTPFLGTPAYMSPEQAEMRRLDVDTRSDIYSLGVLLYELLTGRPPFDTKRLVESGVEEMRRAIREREPQRPSALLAALPCEERKEIAARRRTEEHRLAPAVRGDLDWIVMKTLEKDRRRRYETANGLAMDIRRHLNNELVSARSPSRLYRLQKLVRRNRVVFVAGLLVFLALVSGLGASTWLFLRERDARREQARLHDEAEQARANEVRLRQHAEAREKTAQAAVLLSHGNQAHADALVADLPFALIQPSLESANVFRTLGEWHALAERWPEAAERHAALTQVIVTVDASDSDDVSRSLLPAGAAICENGAADRYDQFRQMAIARFGLTLNPIVAEQLIKATLLAPADPETLRALAPLGEIVARTVSGQDPLGSADAYMDAWRCFALSLLEHRRGNDEKSLAWATQCLAYPSDNAPRQAAVNLLIAMACHHLHRESEARFELARNRELIQQQFNRGLDAGGSAKGFWFDWVNARLLLREATALIEH